MKRIIYSVIGLLAMGNIMAQEEPKFEFTPVHDVKTTSVKCQDRTGTCWSYSTTSYIETEVLRLGGPELDLAEMYFARYTYSAKAHKYIMLHGKGNFSQGGQAHDVMNVIKDYGMATQEAYEGRKDVSVPHNHSELESTQKALLDNFMKQKGASPKQEWYDVQDAILDIYLGEAPEKVEGKTPQEFAKAMKINPDDYIELTSYTNYPYYQLADLDVPDNWSDDLYYNLPIDELMEVMNYALANGFSFVWDGDVSEKYFSHKEGVALLPVDEKSEFEPTKEKSVTQEDRQQAFLSWQCTDDHLMHITGMVKDQNGTMYYKTKNSWGTERNTFGGYLNMSESFVRLNTVAIMVHKDALPKAIAKKLKLK